MRHFVDITGPEHGAQEIKARLIAVVKSGRLSKLGREIEVTSEAVMQHMAQRLSYADPGFHLEVYTDTELEVRVLLPIVLLDKFDVI